VEERQAGIRDCPPFISPIATLYTEAHKDDDERMEYQNVSLQQSLMLALAS